MYNCNRSTSGLRAVCEPYALITCELLNIDKEVWKEFVMKNLMSHIKRRRIAALQSSRKLLALALVILFLCSTLPGRTQAAAGDLDPTFGVGGKVSTDFGADDSANDVAIQSDGKIVVVGRTFFNFALARYNRDGSLDPDFGSGGKVITEANSIVSAQAVAIQSDGKIVVAGQDSEDFATIRYNSDGTLDTSFGVGGKVVTNFFNHDAALAIALQPDGKIIVGGGFQNARRRFDFALARYNSDGSLDTSFGAGGLPDYALCRLVPHLQTIGLSFGNPNGTMTSASPGVLLLRSSNTAVAGLNMPTVTVPSPFQSPTTGTLPLAPNGSITSAAPGELSLRK
jgi:uncharacterized delta-60 repeat protein